MLTKVTKDDIYNAMELEVEQGYAIYTIHYEDGLDKLVPEKQTYTHISAVLDASDELYYPRNEKRDYQYYKSRESKGNPYFIGVIEKLFYLLTEHIRKNNKETELILKKYGGKRISAIEMFDKLGYVLSYCDDDNEEFVNKEDYISFYKKDKTYVSCSYELNSHNYYSRYITLEEHQAITQRMKELGWLE